MSDHPLNMRSKLDLLRLFVFALLGLAGTLQILYATTWGPVAYSDSTEYIVSARNLLAGKGLGLVTPTGRLMPLYFHPPLFPLSISILGLPGYDLVQASRWINAVLFGSLIFLVGVSSWSLSQSFPLGVALSVLTFTSPLMASTFTSALSEPLFLVLGLSAMIATILATERQNLALLVGAAALAGLTAITRYVGVAFIVAGSALLVLFYRGSRRAGVLRGASYAAIGLVPIMIWAGYLQLAQAGTRPRTLVFTMDIWSQLAPFRIAMAEFIWSWVPLLPGSEGIPYRGKLVFAAAMAVLLLAGFLRARRSFASLARASAGQERMLRATALLLIFALAYVGVLAFSYVFVFPTFDLAQRIFFPFLLAGSGAFLFMTHILSSGLKLGRWRALFFVSVISAAAIAQAPEAYSSISSLHESGNGYTSSSWQSSGTIEALRALDPSIPLISNESAAIMLLTNRSPFEIPELETGEPRALHARFGDGETRAERTFREQGAALVLFDNFKMQMYPLYKEETDQRLEALTNGLYQYSVHSDGSIYFYDDPSLE